MLHKLFITELLLSSLRSKITFRDAYGITFLLEFILNQIIAIF